MPAWTVPPPAPFQPKPRKQYQHSPEWYVRKAARDAALKAEADAVGLSAYALRKSRTQPAGMRVGESKTMQVGLRLSDEEVALHVRVNAHLPVPSFSAWVQFCITSFLARPQQEVLYAALREWKMPSPGKHARNVCITPSARSQLERFAHPLKLATATRFAMFVESQYYLLQPSAAERAEQEAAQLLKSKEMQAERAAEAPVLVPVGNGFTTALTEKTFWPTTIKKEDNES